MEKILSQMDFISHQHQVIQRQNRPVVHLLPQQIAQIQLITLSATQAQEKFPNLS